MEESASRTVADEIQLITTLARGDRCPDRHSGERLARVQVCIRGCQAL